MLIFRLLLGVSMVLFASYRMGATTRQTLVKDTIIFLGTLIVLYWLVIGPFVTIALQSINYDNMPNPKPVLIAMSYLIIIEFGHTLAKLNPSYHNKP